MYDPSVGSLPELASLRLCCHLRSRTRTSIRGLIYIYIYIYIYNVNQHDDEIDSLRNSNWYNANHATQKDYRLRKSCQV